MTPPSLIDDAVEDLLDLLDPLTPLAAWTPLPNTNGSISWTDVLPTRNPFCPAPCKSCEVAHSFLPRPSDVIITTAPKTGTILLQFMAHLLRSDAGMDFSDIYDVTPWILVNPLYKGDASDVIQTQHPRVFRNHQSLAEFKGGRHIVLLRDPAAVLKSYHAFLNARRIPFMRHNGYLHTIAELSGMSSTRAEWWLGSTWKDIAEFQHSSLGWRRDMGFGISLVAYYIEFWHARHDTNVLLVCYEDLVANRLRWASEIAAFMNVAVSTELLDRVAYMTSKEFMLQHISKFDGSEISHLINKGNRFSIRLENSLKEKEDAIYSPLSPHTLDLLHLEWKHQITPSTGFDSYSAMRTAWQEEHRL